MTITDAINALEAPATIGQITDLAAAFSAEGCLDGHFYLTRNATQMALTILSVRPVEIVLRDHLTWECVSHDLRLAGRHLEAEFAASVGSHLASAVGMGA